MLSYSVHTVSHAISAVTTGKGSSIINQVAIDSRSVGVGKGTLFFAIVGERHDGHEYIPELYQGKDVRLFVVSRKDNYSNQFPNATFLVVDSTLAALQRLAAFHREQFKYPVVGITGSNGKTVVKEWLAQLLTSRYRVVRSPKSYNSQVGVPLSVLGMTNDFSMAVFEAGISRPGEMKALQPIVAPSIGLFTNIGAAHDENFASRDEKVMEKMQLFLGCDVLIYCSDNPTVHKAALELESSHGVSLFSWGRGGKPVVKIKDLRISNGSSGLTITHSGSTVNLSVPFTDTASLENAMHCVALMLHLGFSATQIEGPLVQLTPVAMRLELKEGVNGCTIINDSYNSDLGSLSIALDYLMQQKQHTDRVLILSDILQSGLSPKALYAEVARLVAEKGVSHLVGIGSEVSSCREFFTLPSEFYPNTEAYLSQLNRTSIKDTAVLIKGSRIFGFERISLALEQKTHRTVLEVNLNAMVHNLNYFRSLLRSGVKLMVMVKAFSYGSGAHEIASILQYHRVDYLGVAFADEGVALREAGITLPIVVLNPAYGSYELMIRHNLEPEVFSFSSLESFLSVAVRLGVKRYPIHVKIDTGMHRLGFAPNQVNALCARLNQQSKYIKVQSILSHLVGTDNPDHDDFTNEQIDCFRSASSTIINSIGYRPILHILNSGGIERFPNAQLDMVRLGIGLYGISATHEQHLQTVSTLKSFVAQVRALEPGDTVGYSRKGVVGKPSVIATIPIGYADGLNRRLSNGVGGVLIRGQYAPFIGNICMDISMVDATDIDAQEGDEVIVFGENPSIEDIASKLGTIPYEVLTSISRRVKRVYFQE